MGHRLSISDWDVKQWFNNIVDKCSDNLDVFTHLGKLKQIALKSRDIIRNEIGVHTVIRRYLDT